WLGGGGSKLYTPSHRVNFSGRGPPPPPESWVNINAMDDLVEAVLTTTDRFVVSAIGGNAAAGGVMLALAADEVWCRSGSVLNPHYRLMGLYGSEYWTYTLPRRVGAATAERLTGEAAPLTASAALGMGLVDRILHCGPDDFTDNVTRTAVHLAVLPSVQTRLAAKKAEAEHREATSPLARHREQELARMRSIFDDPAAPYHALRRAFVRKESAATDGGIPDAALAGRADC
ncbi:enoyl-CoA hydratase/isomerase family protein, partial [Streptomyces sp. NPDC127091]|uniref:enoyl-CoA hydratase/isomerase family protein n=1 Tax=Streptomyces sp. NPDC127091 TaxID=3347134 RepID=UPI00364D6578